MMVKPVALKIAIAAVVTCALCGCACTQTTDANATMAAEEIRVFDPEQLSEDRYALVKRLWVDSWRTAAWLPAQASAADGVAALRVEARRLGANALVGVACYDQGHAYFDWRKNPRIICYGNAIRTRE